MPLEAKSRASLPLPRVMPPVKVLLPIDRIAPAALAAPGPRPEPEISRAIVRPVMGEEVAPWMTSEPPLKPGLPVLPKPKIPIADVPRPSWPALVTTRLPPRMAISPVKVLPLFESTNVPSPVLRKPLTPASREEIVARLPVLTEIVGVAAPAGAANVSVLPSSENAPEVTPVKTSPPTVKPEPNETEPPAPMKMAVSLLASVHAMSFVPSNHFRSVEPQAPAPPRPAPVDVLLPAELASLSQVRFAALAEGGSVLPMERSAAATIREARERVERGGVGTGAVFEKPTPRILLLETET